MEFIRFGSTIPGSYWGCCAVDVIQNFKVDPDAKSSIQIVSGDSGSAIGDKFAGPTYRDIFKTRIRVGTFGGADMPNHGFLAVLTEQQINGGVGKKWLEILKAEGFEFLRTVDNSVYTGPGLATSHGGSHKNYIFGLFRNIGNGKVKDQFTPPSAWTNLPDPYEGDMSQGNRDKVQLELWKKGETKFLTKAQVKAAGAPVVLAGIRSKFKQQTEEEREALKAQEAKPKAPSAFPLTAPAAIAAPAEITA